MIGPVALFAVVFLGGPVISPCLGLRCPAPVDGPTPIIGTMTGYVMACYALGLAWLVASVAVTWIVIRGHSDQTRGLLARSGIGGAVGAIVAVTQLAAGDRLRSVATTGLTVTVLAAIALWVLGGGIVVWRSNR